MNQKEWEEAITKYMENGGWTKDRDDYKTLGFSFIQGDHRWIRDYDKKERRYVHFDGNQRVNLKVTKEEDAQ
jgi:hypothetical protein